MESGIIKNGFIRDMQGDWISLNCISRFSAMELNDTEWTISIFMSSNPFEEDMYERTFQDDFATEQDAQGFLDSLFEVAP